MTGDQNQVRVRFCHARGDRADAHFRHQLHGNARLRIDVLQIIDQLRQIFDRVDVMVRGRRDQSHAGRGMAHAGNGLIDLVTGQLSAFAGLRTLRDFDLQLVGVDQVFGGDAEAS